MIRLKIVNALSKKPLNMKELSEMTDLSYSSISTTLHDLELRGMVYNQFNKYFLSNCIKLHMERISEIKKVVNFLVKFFNIIESHAVDTLPCSSICELDLLDGSDLLQSDSMDVFKVFNVIEEILKDAKHVRCIFPVFHENFNDRLNDLIDEGIFVEIKASVDVFKIYEKKSKTEFLSSFDSYNNFLLIITNEIMILGFFKEDGTFDQNRIIVSTSNDSLVWANKLFKRFKKLHK